MIKPIPGGECEGSLTQADFAANYRRLRSQARRLVRHEADADDVVQDAMERAWRLRGRFASNAAAGPWLAAITRNAAYDLLRTRRLDADSNAAEEPRATDDMPETTLLRREMASSLGTAIRTLAPAYRDAIVLHDLLGLSSREIASRRRLPYHTVRTHLFRARRALRGALASGVAA